MKSNKFIGTVAAGAAVVAIFLSWRHFSGPAINLQPSAAVGEVLADEIGRLLGGGGTVALISRQPSPDGPDANREMIASLAAAIGRRAKLKLATPDWLPRPAVGTMDLGVVTPEQFSTALRKNPEAKAILVLAGMPTYAQPLVDKLAERNLKLIAVCGYSANVKRWLESRALAVTIIPRFADLPPGTPAPKTAHDWFRREFEILTPETLGRAPY